jgi:hypothetical protein
MYCQLADSTKHTVDLLRQMDIPYPEEWHMFTELSDDKKYACFTGSMGGDFIIRVDEANTVERITNAMFD